MAMRSALLVTLLAVPFGGCAQLALHPQAQSQPAVSSAGWDWASGIPEAVPRAAVIPPVVTEAGWACLTPGAQGSGVRTAAATEACSLRIVQVGGRPVHDFEEFHAAVCRAEGKASTEVVVRATGSGGETTLTAAGTPDRLRALEQLTAPDRTTLWVTEEGNPWVVVRDGGLCCKVHARVERHHGLLQVVLATGVVAGPETRLPVDVHASCDGQPLHCLTAAETLTLLYGTDEDRHAMEHPHEAAALDRTSFAAVAERSDYRIPTNYRRLEKQQHDVPAVPALAVVPGVFYPGPPLLGDARALAAFLLQPELCQPDGGEKVGWVMFAGKPLQAGGRVEIDVNLGQSTTRLIMTVPAG